MITSILDGIRQAGRLLSLLEKWTLVGLMVFLASFAFLQIILRNFFSTGFVWGDTLNRHLVVWIGFLGAVRATAERKHIRIDLLPVLLPPAGRAVVRILCSLVPLIVCAILSYASWTFVQNEREGAVCAFGSVPYWWLQLIFPFGFALMSLRFGWQAIKDLTGASGDKNGDGDGDSDSADDSGRQP